MVDPRPAVMRLLLLPFITTGVKEVVSAGERFDISFPCGDTVCFHIWTLGSSGRDPVAIISNGQIQRSRPEGLDSGCLLKVRDSTTADAGRHRCRRRSDGLTSHSGAPAVELVPGKPVSLQCVLLTYVTQRHCYSDLQRWVHLTWVDEVGEKIEEDPDTEIAPRTSCNTTVTVTLRQPGNRTFRCQATSGGQVQTSGRLQVQVPGRATGRGRGFINDLAPPTKGGNHGAAAAAATAGVLGCAAGAVLAALFVRTRRNANTPLPDESCYTSSANNAASSDDVVYADLFHPGGSDKVSVHRSESTEYACVRYNPSAAV